VAYTEDGGHARIFYITLGYRLVDLDATTGQPLADFGVDGVVDLKALLDQNVDLDAAQIGASSAPLVINNTLVVGSAFPSGAAPSSPEMIKGHILGIDLGTGERKWIFHTVPQSDEFGNETWLRESWRYTGNTGAWAQASGDPDLNMVYVPVEAATGDFYGGHRPGDNLFSQSLVALDASTGLRQWHFQMVKHGVWDYDPPAPPVLFNSRQNGVTIPAVAQVSKQGFVYAFDRRDGKPLWPIEDRPVPQSTAPGEISSPTQPFPTKPMPFTPQGMSEAQLNDLTAEVFAEAKRIAGNYTMGPLYTPPSLVTESNHGTLVMPSAFGGANWPGAVVDLETGVLYVSASHDPGVMGLRSSDRSTMNLVSGGIRYRGPFGLPLTKPPYGTITAIDMNSGEHLWRIANGDTPARIADHPKLKGVQIPRTGQAERVGLLVTKSLLFAGEGSGLYVANGGGPMLRAHDKQSGEILWEFRLPANQSGLPMTYAINGEQYIVIPIGAQGYPGELIAFKLP
jgi:quinoprotein glucose dehydrogenase